VGFGVVVKGRMVKGRGGHEYGKRGINLGLKCKMHAMST